MRRVRGVDRVRAVVVEAWAAIVTMIACTGALAAGRPVGQWTLQSSGAAVVQRRPEFAPAAGPLLHLRADDRATATATRELPKTSIPYAVSWWVYVTEAPYDDLALYQARDRDKALTDVRLILREAKAKLPARPEEWRGVLWVEDAGGGRSVAALRRPGWHRFRLTRKSPMEVDLLLDGEPVGTYRALSAEPARLLEVGDPSVSEGGGELYWGGASMVPDTAGSTGEAEAQAWQCAASGGGTAEVGREFVGLAPPHLRLRASGKANCGAEWGPVSVRVPYHFWFQVYVSEEPYRSFHVVTPRAADGEPTDIAIEFDDEAATAGSARPEPSPRCVVWVTDAEGRHNLGPVVRGVWHEFAISRRKPREVALWRDGAPVRSFTPRSTKPVSTFQFGDAASETSRGEAYWFWIRLVEVPQE